MCSCYRKYGSQQLSWKPVWISYHHYHQLAQVQLSHLRAFFDLRIAPQPSVSNSYNLSEISVFLSAEGRNFKVY